MAYENENTDEALIAAFIRAEGGSLGLRPEAIEDAVYLAVVEKVVPGDAEDARFFLKQHRGDRPHWFAPVDASPPPLPRYREEMTPAQKAKLIDDIGMAGYLERPYDQGAEARELARHPKRDAQGRFVGQLLRARMSAAAKSQFISQHGSEAFLALPYDVEQP